MQQWRAISILTDGVVAVGFMDEDRVIVGSHSGIGIDVHTGERVGRTHDEKYNWYHGDPPFIRYLSAGGMRLFRAAGLWGGDPDQSTANGWTCQRVDGGAVLSADGQQDVRIEDREEYRAQRFSPGGGTFVYATAKGRHCRDHYPLRPTLC